MATPAIPSTDALPAETPVFVDRRRGESSAPGRERRQFANSHDDLSPAGAELARAIDRYKLENRRRFINADELLSVMTQLGYQK